MVPTSSAGAVLMALAIAVTGCGAASPTQEQASRSSARVNTEQSVPRVHSRPAPAAAAPGAPVTRVLAVSIDGLRSSAITQLGRAGTPTLHRLMTQGASTLNARTEREMTVTLPNHTGMVTGRRIAASRGGHGV